MKLQTAKDMIEALRKWGMSHNRIATEIGVRNTTISRLAKGVAKAPHVKTEQAIRSLYNKYIGE